MCIIIITILLCITGCMYDVEFSFSEAEDVRGVRV